MSIDTLTAAIRHALERTRHLIAGLGASKDQTTEVHGRIAALGADTSAAHAGATVEHLEEGQALAAAIEQRLESALAAAEAARTGSGSGGGGAPPGPPPTPAPGPERRPFKPMRTDPEKRDEILPYTSNTREAFGRQYNTQGEPLGPVHVASDDGPASDTRDVKEPWASYPRMKRHVEAHAAARMRRGGLTETALYINLPPCSYADGCKLNIADLLPKGSKLWVHQVRPNGMVKVHKFEGTGKGLK